MSLVFFSTCGKSKRKEWDWAWIGSTPNGAPKKLLGYSIRGNENMKFHNPEPVEPDHIEQIISAGDDYEICSMMIGLALNSDQPDIIFQTICILIENKDVNIRRAATISLAHLVRIHGLPEEIGSYVALVKAALNDPSVEVRGAASDVIDDVSVFTPEALKYFKSLSPKDG